MALGAGAACNRRADPVLAKVGRYAIRESEFQRKLGEVSQEYQNYVQTPLGRRQFLEVLVREKLILAAASDSGIHKTPEFKGQWEKIRAEEADRLAEGKDYLMTQLWLEDLRKKGVLGVGDSEADAYHRKHPNEVSVRHVLLPTPEEAEAAAKQVRSGANMADIARKRSIDPATAADGGLMKPALYGEIIPELEDVVFRSKVGEVVGPVRSKFGYHVLRKESERSLPPAQALERVRKVLEKERLDRHLQTMQPRYPVEVLDAQFH